MRIIEPQNKVSIDAQAETKKFGFIFNAKMVKILSDSLYTDKVLAIVRELSSNAYDSHVENGNSNHPFDVHLPTTFQPEFYIRDYGVGLSPDRIDNIYRFYGGSDRSESNEYVGGMGLGSKTPFCYHTRSFTVDSWYGGVHYSYSAFIGDDGIPNIVLMNEQLSNEHTGVKITLPVAVNDARLFANAASWIYKFYEVQPRILGSKYVVIEKPEYSLCSDDGVWKYDSSNEYNSGLKIIMGQVVYNVTAFDDLSTIQRHVLNSSFHVFVKIGDVSVDAARENLSYDNRTKVKIRGYVNRIISDFNAKIHDEISKCGTLWDARNKFVSLRNKSTLKLFDPTKILFNGNPLFPDDSCSIDLSDLTKTDPVTKTKKVELILFAYGSWRKEKRKYVNNIGFAAEKKLFHNNIRLGGFVRAEWYRAEHKTNVILINFIDKDDKVKQELYDRLGLGSNPQDYVTDISTIPSPTIRRVGPRSRLTKVVNLIETSHYVPCSKSAFWTNCEIDTSDRSNIYLYVEFNRYKYKHGNGAFIDPDVLFKICKKLEILGVKLPSKVYGIKSADIKGIKGKKNFIDFNKWANETIRNIVINKNYYAEQVHHEDIKSVNKDTYAVLSFTSIVKLAQYLPANHPIVKLSKDYDNAKSKSSFYKQHGDTICGLLFEAGVKVERSECGSLPERVLKSQENQIRKKYVLFGCIDGSNVRGEDGYKHLAKYVKCVDNNSI